MIFFKVEYYIMVYFVMFTGIAVDLDSIDQRIM